MISRATQAQSVERRLVRALFLTTIPRTAIYQRLLLIALAGWGDARITLALDTTRVLKQWCLICVSLTYRGRAIPVAWQLLNHNSSAVSLRAIRPVLASVYALLSQLPHVEEVSLGADRGFMDHQLMAILSAYGWRWHIRGKGRVKLYTAQGQAVGHIGQHLSPHGAPVFLNDVYITKHRFGPVNLAAWHPKGVRDPWFILSSQPCHRGTFDEYATRFQIEEGFLDLKSGGFDLEGSHFRRTAALQGLIFVLALGALLLFSEGTDSVAQGLRRTVDPHWQRGLSYFQLGRRSILARLTRRLPLLTHLLISPPPDPQPSRRPRDPPHHSSSGEPLS